MPLLLTIIDLQFMYRHRLTANINLLQTLYLHADEVPEGKPYIKRTEVLAVSFKSSKTTSFGISLGVQLGKVHSGSFYGTF